MNGGRSIIVSKSFECRGIHPYPLFFSTSQPLIPDVKYLLSLHMTMADSSGMMIEDLPVATIWGFQVIYNPFDSQNFCERRSQRLKSTSKVRFLRANILESS